jgi:hypothetical protein
MTMRTVYFILFILGTVRPYFQFFHFVAEEGLNGSVFFQHLHANHVSAFFAYDVTVSAIVLIVFILAEQRKTKTRLYWLAIVATFLAGVSSGFPLFLFLREKE